MNALIVAGILDRAGQSLGGFLPRLAGALVLLAVGLIVARIIGRTVAKALEAAGLDAFAETHDIDDALERIGLQRPVSTLVGRALRIALSLVVVFAALSLLGLQFLSDSLNAATLYIPDVLVALVILVAGLAVAAILRRRVDRLTEQMDLPVPLGRLTEIAVLAIFAVTAATQLAIATATLVSILVVLLGAVALTLALAFGLGGREVARAVSAARYARESLSPGQRIAVAGFEGTVEAIEPTALVLRIGPDRTVRLPSHLLLETPVTVFDGPA